jgi:hypothetical protein
MLINKYLPQYTFNEYHKVLVNGSTKDCFLVARNLDMSGSFITKILMKLRGLPVKDLTLKEFTKNVGFTYLEEDRYKEFVIDASQTQIKIIWNFHFTEHEKNKTIVSTETRILCLTKKSKFFFSIYWFFVKPFSGIIRYEMLKLIKTKVENN